MPDLYGIDGELQPISLDDAAGLAGYTRTSWDSEDRIEAQREAIEEWADANGFQIVGFYDDQGVSGKLPIERRRALLRAVMSVEEGRATGIAVRSLDRLARDVIGQEIILAAIWRAGGEVYTTELGIVVQDETDTFERQTVRLSLARRNEDRRRESMEALRRGRARKAARQGYIGGALTRPYGLELVEDFPTRGRRDYRPIAAEQAIIRRLCAECSEGKGYQRMADTLNAEGVPTVTGVPWSRPVVYGIVKRGPVGLTGLERVNKTVRQANGLAATPARRRSA